MQRYLRPDLLADAGVEHFDQWAATFGQTITEIEMAPTGGGSYRLATRFSRFANVPEMLRIWHVFADVKTAEDLDLRSEVACDTDFLERDTVVKPQRRDLQRVVAKQERARRQRHRVRVRRELEMHARERARGKLAFLVVSDQLDQQGARFLVYGVRGRHDRRLECAIGILGQSERGLHAVLENGRIRFRRAHVHAHLMKVGDGEQGRAVVRIRFDQ